MEKVIGEPAMGQSDLDALNDNCRVLNAEINGLVENRMRSGQVFSNTVEISDNELFDIIHSTSSLAGFR